MQKVKVENTKFCVSLQLFILWALLFVVESGRGDLWRASAQSPCPKPLQDLHWTNFVMTAADSSEKGRDLSPQTAENQNKCHPAHSLHKSQRKTVFFCNLIWKMMIMHQWRGGAACSAASIMTGSADWLLWSADWTQSNAEPQEWGGGGGNGQSPSLGTSQSDRGTW